MVCWISLPGCNVLLPNRIQWEVRRRWSDKLFWGRWFEYFRQPVWVHRVQTMACHENHRPVPPRGKHRSFKTSLCQKNKLKTSQFHLTYVPNQDVFKTSSLNEIFETYLLKTSEVLLVRWLCLISSIIRSFDQTWDYLTVRVLQRVQSSSEAPSSLFLSAHHHCNQVGSWSICPSALSGRECCWVMLHVSH